ncbi:MAG: cell division protein ZapE [Chloroflexi bacterium]|nr:cell division protein ZapE [Chloroflexota bacterium]
MRHLPAVSQTSLHELIRRYVPTRRFGRVSFDSYVPDDAYASQRAALEGLERFASDINGTKRRRLWFRRRSDTRGPRAIYLDGGYGVGKTHLLAATYHAVHGKRAYLSFAELAYTISRMGMHETLSAFRQLCLLCIDEFELDDVAQTRMAATFLRGLLTGNTRVVTTSNTLPGDLGQGRFAAEAFQRDIGEIASAFEVVTIDGQDYRHRLWTDLGTSEVQSQESLREAFEADATDEKVMLHWPDLATELEAVHPVHYAQIAAKLDALYVDSLECIDDQAVALRLVHFVDKLYDQEVRLTLSTRNALPLGEIFAESYRHGGYEKKYRRCLSRLHELVSETNAARSSKIRSGRAS